jgi:hypothetical protein
MTRMGGAGTVLEPYGPPRPPSFGSNPARRGPSRTSSTAHWPAVAKRRSRGALCCIPCWGHCLQVGRTSPNPSQHSECHPRAARHPTGQSGLSHIQLMQAIELYSHGSVPPPGPHYRWRKRKDRDKPGCHLIARSKRLASDALYCRIPLGEDPPKEFESGQKVLSDLRVDLTPEQASRDKSANRASGGNRNMFEPSTASQTPP